MKNIALALAILAGLFISPAFADHQKSCCKGGTAPCCQDAKPCCKD